MNTHISTTRIVSKPSRRVFLAALLFGVTSTSSLHAQTVAPAASTAPADEEIVELSKFSVSASKDSDGYRATDTLAGTRIRTELKDVGSAVSVVTAKFLKDTGSVKGEDLLVYTTNTEVGGIGGNYTGAGNGPYLDTANARLTPQNNTRVRGLAAADNTRDFFITDIPWDGYIVGRVDLQRGPNSILFGLGSPAGIVNSSINQASFKDSNAVEGRFGSFSSMRATADFNKVLLNDELSLRASLLYDNTKYQQKPAFNKDERYYVAGRYDPKFLRFGDARTSIRVNFEHGNVQANRPRYTPPVDAITPWFTAMGKQTYDPRTVNVADPVLIAAGRAVGDYSQGALSTTLAGGGGANPNYQPWLGSAGAIYENMVMAFDNTNSSAWSKLFPGVVNGSANMPGGIGSSGAIDKTIMGLPYSPFRGVNDYNIYAKNMNFEDYKFGVYKAKTLTDTGIFDFYNNLLDGNSKREWQNFEAANVALTQTFLKDRLGVEAVYDWQKYSEGRTSLLSGAQTLTIDVNRYLPDGSVNPNVGRPMVVGDNNGNFSRDTERKSWRFTAYGELNFNDFMDKGSWITRVLGRHVFTGLYGLNQNDESTRTWYRYATDSAFGDYIGFKDIRSNQRLLATTTYLGPTLTNASSASGAHIKGIQAAPLPTSGVARYFDSTWKATGVNPADPYTLYSGETSTQSENPNNYVGWTNMPIGIWNADTGDINNLYNGGSLSRDKITSSAIIWQGFFWDGVVVPTVGLRRDTLKTYKIQADTGNNHVINDQTYTANFNSPNWHLPSSPTNEESGNSTSWSIVVHTPKWIADKMPARTNISLFYNRSSNFQPAGSRVDVLGNAVSSPTGKTKDYGFVINTLNDRLTLKVNWYTTSIKNATLNGISNDYMVGAAEAWGYMYAMQAKNLFGSFADYAATGGYQPVAGQSDADAKAHAEAAVNAFLANPPSAQFMNAWHFGDQLNNWQGWIQSTGPAGMAVTGDTMSKGIEFELTSQITKNWNLTLNVAKTNATRTNMAASFTKWVEDRWAFYQTVAGDVQLWGPWAGMETVRGKFEAEFYSGYRLYRLQEGGDVPELRPWRFNIVTNYNFDQGWLKGFNVGVGYRWQDRVVTGYPLKDIPGSGGDKDFDLDHPYHGPTEDSIDFWMGYQHKLTKNVTWRIQFNARNLFQKAHLVPVTVQADGSPAASRIAEGMVWSITNRFEF